MKKTRIAVIAVLLAFAGVANATLLIQDTFDTSNNTDINLDLANRQTGSLAQTTWGENGLGAATISGNKLAIGGNNSESGSAIMVSLDHNFTDAAITSGGGFSVSFDMTSFSGIMGFGLGLTDAGRKELGRTGSGSNYGFVWDRPSTDWAFTTQGNIYVQVAEEGAATTTFTAPTANTQYNYRVDVTTANFNSGTTAAVAFYIDDTLIDEGREFTWDGDGGNYLVFGAYRPIPTGTIDNFSVSAIPEPATLSMIGIVGIAMLLRRRIVRG